MLPDDAAELLEVREVLARAGLVHRFAAFHDDSLPFPLEGRPAFAESVARGAFVRVSVQAYNTPQHMERLLGAIEKYL